MPATKIVISLSDEALALVDSLAAQEGLSRSAWLERTILRAKRGSGMRRAIDLAHGAGISRATAVELARLRKELDAQR